MAPFLYSALTNLLTAVLGRFVKPEILTKADVQKLDLSKLDNLLPVKDVSLGYATKVAFRKQNQKLNDKDILVFKNDCRKHLIASVEKIRERSPLAYKLTKGITCFDPAVAAHTQVANERLGKALEYFVSKHWLSGVTADAIDREYKRFCSSSNVKDQLRAFSRTAARLDHFWRDLFKNHAADNCDHLIEFFRMVMIFSHGNASLERGFSINKECLGDNQHEISLIAQRRIYDAITAAGGLANFSIDKKLVHAARNAHSLYREYQEEQRKLKNEQQRKNEEKKRKADEMKELNAKKQKILASAELELQAIDMQIQALQK